MRTRHHHRFPPSRRPARLMRSSKRTRRLCGNHRPRQRRLPRPHPLPCRLFPPRRRQRHPRRSLSPRNRKIPRQRHSPARRRCFRLLPGPLRKDSRRPKRPPSAGHRLPRLPCSSRLRRRQRHLCRRACRLKPLCLLRPLPLPPRRCKRRQPRPRFNHPRRPFRFLTCRPLPSGRLSLC